METKRSTEFESLSELGLLRLVGAAKKQMKVNLKHITSIILVKPFFKKSFGSSLTSNKIHVFLIRVTSAFWRGETSCRTVAAIFLVVSHLSGNSYRSTGATRKLLQCLKQINPIGFNRCNLHTNA